ncbi:MAG: hypothetical protein ACRD50_14510 [Candidatus Acidiferrales bacterium]
MNKTKWTCIAILILGAGIFASAPALAQTPLKASPPAGNSTATNAAAKPTTSKTSVAAQTGERFYIISSIDVQKNQLLLKLPTEVTRIMSVGPKTTYLDESGKPIKLTDLRAGDTVWVLAGGGSGADQVAIRIRKGAMTVQELHKSYLHY